VILYLDASSLVKLYVIEPPEPNGGRQAGWESEEVRGYFRGAESTFTARISYTEARSALARRLRENYFVLIRKIMQTPSTTSTMIGRRAY